MGQQRAVMYELHLVGGRYDGAKHLVYRDDGSNPVPETILVGRCPGDGLCTASEQMCLQQAGGNSHVFYWLPEEEERPQETTTYEKEADYVYRDAQGVFAGIARYVVAGLALPGAESAPERAKVLA